MLLHLGVDGKQLSHHFQPINMKPKPFLFPVRNSHQSIAKTLACTIGIYIIGFQGFKISLFLSGRFWTGFQFAKNVFKKKKGKRQKNGPGRVQVGRIFPPFGRKFPRFGRVWWTPLEFTNHKTRLGEKKFWTPTDGCYIFPLILHRFINHVLRNNSSPFRWQVQSFATPQILCYLNKVAIRPGVTPRIVGVDVNQWCL